MNKRIKYEKGSNKEKKKIQGEIKKNFLNLLETKKSEGIQVSDDVITGESGNAQKWYALTDIPIGVGLSHRIGHEITTVAVNILFNCWGSPTTRFIRLSIVSFKDMLGTEEPTETTRVFEGYVGTPLSWSGVTNTGNVWDQRTVQMPYHQAVCSVHYDKILKLGTGSNDGGSVQKLNTKVQLRSNIVFTDGEGGPKTQSRRYFIVLNSMSGAGSVTADACHYSLYANLEYKDV